MKERKKTRKSLISLSTSDVHTHIASDDLKLGFSRTDVIDEVYIQ